MADQRALLSTIKRSDQLIAYLRDELNWPMIIDTPEKVKTSGRDSENLKVKHLKNGKYIIEYFLPTDLNNPIHTSTDYGPNVRIEHILGDQLNDYIIIIKVKKL